MQKIIALSLRDLKNIYRDMILLAGVMAPILLAIFLKYLVPHISHLLWTHLAFDLTNYYRLIMSVCIFVPPMMFGMLTGFMILDERDEDLLAYYSVTPLTKTGYIVYRLLSSIVLSIILTYFVVLYSNLVAIQPLLVLPIIFMLSLGAPMLALVMSVVADNKVEGLAISKAAGLVLVFPFIVFFIESDWQWLAGILPPYWISKAFLTMSASSSVYWLSIMIGFILHGGVLVLLIRRFNQRIG